MKKDLYYLSVNTFKGAYLAISLFIFLQSCGESKATEEEPGIFTKVESLYQHDLKTCISYLDSLQNSRTKEDFRKYYQEARRYFKYTEPLLAFADISNYRYLNQPNILKADEDDFTDIKIKEPSGFQVLEELIFADTTHGEEIGKHAGQTGRRLKLISKNTFLKKYENYHFLWLLRNGVNRVALTGITGFDSPVPEFSLQESAFVYESLKNYLAIFKDEFKDPELYKAWVTEIDQTLGMLNGDFNEFDRFSFIKNHTHPQLSLWVETVEDWQVKFPFSMSMNHRATSLFSDETFNLPFFADPHSGEATDEKVLLGKMLFNDSRLSASGKVSCGTCHQQAMAFTDGKKISDRQTRNSPTLTYAGLQQAFFYDGRSGSLEGQIMSVVESETEFHTNLEALVKFVSEDAVYQKAFGKVYQNGITDHNIRNAIAAYIRNLAPFYSRFDRNISGTEESLTQREIRGFNLFTGKAKCATCHFAPVFNGTVPPEFSETELEHLGVPATTDTLNAVIDQDLGRYNLYKTEERRFFFKTPTVRNIALTAPYMHNGVYETLEEVLDFYDRGGGAGMGIQQELQTLPADRLHLTEEEKQDIIAFLKTLTDTESGEKDM